MTLFGLIWIIILAMNFYKVENMVVITIVSSVFQCNNVIAYGNVAIGPQIITSIIFVIRIFIKQGLKAKYRKQDWNIGKYAYLICIIMIISSIYNGVLGNSVIRLMQLFFYILCSSLMYCASDSIDDIMLYRIIRRLSICLIIFGFIQIIITSGIIPKTFIFQQLFFNDTNEYVYYHIKKRYCRVFSTYMEPSYYAGFIVGAFYYFLVLKEKRKSNYLLIIFLGIQLILTFSSTAYGSFALTGLLFLLVDKEKKYKFKILIIGILGFLIIYLCLPNILDTVIFNKFESDSYYGRLGMNARAKLMYIKSPIIGNGYKTSRGSTILYSLLGDSGFVGLIIYLIMNGTIMYRGVFDKIGKNMNTSTQGLCLAISGAFFSQIIAVPDLDICVYWMWMNILMLQLGINKNRTCLSIIKKG